LEVDGSGLIQHALFARPWPLRHYESKGRTEFSIGGKTKRVSPLHPALSMLL
jgi:hypothetical protein